MGIIPLIGDGLLTTLDSYFIDRDMKETFTQKSLYLGEELIKI